MRARSLAAFILCLLAAGLSGFALSVRMHGDQMLMRDEGGCAAFDPAIGDFVAHWTPDADGRCRLSGMYWQRLRQMPPFAGLDV